MLPLAPGRFSTTTCWPSRCPSGSAITRALLSATPPGANGTMMRIAFAGQSCAKALMATNHRNTKIKRIYGLCRRCLEQGDREGTQHVGQAQLQVLRVVPLAGEHVLEFAQSLGQREARFAPDGPDG